MYDKSGKVHLLLVITHIANIPNYCYKQDNTKKENRISSIGILAAPVIVLCAVWGAQPPQKKAANASVRAR
jgi:hypothetical protein